MHMISRPDTWVYGDFAPNPESRDLPGLKARWLLDQMPQSDTLTVLDYGVGEGKHLQLVRRERPRARLVGVDVRDLHSSPNFEFHRVQPQDPLPFAEGTFDLVVSFDVLEHVQSVQHSLDEIRRVMRPGGSFIGFVPMEGGFGPHSLFRLLNPNIFKDTKDHLYAYTRHQLTEWLSSRFRIAAMGYSYHLIGAMLDAAFFASFKIPLVGPKTEKFWRGQENEIYRADAARAKPSIANRLVHAANRLAYYESRLLRQVGLGASGLHFHVVKN
jgi:SAM-dependent methyltransferase